MESYEAFYNFYGEGYEDTLPRELVEAYDIVECLSCVEGCDTLLLKQKSTGKKMVAKCYSGDSTLPGQTEDAQLENIRCAALPYFVGVYKNENYRCILREYIEGVSLDQYVKGHIMTEDVARDLAIALAEAMKALHTSDPVIIHRDIKPKNIIVRDDGSLALIDLGISRVYKKEATSDTVISGTEGFAPPEQYGFMQTDIRSDIYSFGVVLSWLLTGKEQPMKLPLTKLEKVAAKCCAFAPDKRYKNDDELLDALRRTTREYVARRRKKTKWAAVLALVLAVCVMAGALSYRTLLHAGAVKFQEPLIEEAVRLVLDRPDGALTMDDLAQVEELYIQSDTACASMDEFYEVRGVWFGTDTRIRGPITDLSDLSHMPNLKIVYIEAEQIADLSPMKELNELQRIDLACNNISDLSPLEGKETLLEVDFLDNGMLEGIEAVRTWTAIRSLSLENTGSYDGSPVGEFHRYEFLGIKNNSDAWKYLPGMHIDALAIGYAGQKDLDCIRDVPYIGTLYISDSDVRDISALKGREDIALLNMEGCMIDDLSPLFQMPNLVTVEMSASEQYRMEELIAEYGEPQFQINYI
ncbi:MAG: protein kinase [bacterium]|nr:protein kinase [bacterium]MDY4100737.1 protein kinase [Lachnospiraceae bacterium]